MIRPNIATVWNTVVVRGIEVSDVRVRLVQASLATILPLFLDGHPLDFRLRRQQPHRHGPGQQYDPLCPCGSFRDLRLGDV